MQQRFGIGSVLSTGFRIWFKNLIPFLLITLVVYIPLIVWGVSVANTDGSQFATFNLWNDGLIVVLNVLASAAITYGVVMELQGQHASVGACFATGMARFFPVLLVAILQTICIVLGLIALIVPGIIVMCMLYVAPVSSVLERPGVIGALRRSRELTRGHKMEIFGLVLLLGGINAALGELVVQLVVGSGSADSAVAEFSGSARTRFMYVSLALNVITGSLAAVMSAVSYYFLRAEKEGTSAEELARVFD
jgi:hypothetical protein